MPARDLAARVTSSVPRTELVDEDELFILFGGGSEDDAIFGLCGGADGSDTEEWTQFLATPEADLKALASLISAFQLAPSDIHPATDGDDRPLVDVGGLERALQTSTEVYPQFPEAAKQVKPRSKPKPRLAAARRASRWLVINADILSSHVVDTQIGAFLNSKDLLKKHIVVLNASTLSEPEAKQPSAKTRIGIVARSFNRQIKDTVFARSAKIGRSNPKAVRKEKALRSAKAHARVLFKKNAIQSAGVVTHVVLSQRLDRITAKIGDQDKVLVFGLDDSLARQIKAQTDAEVVVTPVKVSQAHSYRSLPSA
tara:strand:- start:987 stop:1922 length:936 start_codon:yes stop_codon:yes gene_type:complete